MKFWHKLVLLPLFGALAAPLFIKGNDGKPLMTIDDWIPKDALAVVDKVSETGPTQAPTSNTVYKFKDAQGVWQLTQRKPVHIAESEIEIITTDPNRNIIQSLDESEIAKVLSSTQRKAFSSQVPAMTTSASTSTEDISSENTSGAGLTTVSMDSALKLIDQAKGMDAVMQKRMEVIDGQVR